MVFTALWCSAILHVPVGSQPKCLLLPSVMLNRSLSGEITLVRTEVHYGRRHHLLGIKQSLYQSPVVVVFLSLPFIGKNCTFVV